MFGSELLEVALGVTLVFLLLSLICSAIQEGIAGLLNQRAKDLKRGIQQLLQDPEFTELARSLYAHPLVAGLFKGGSARRRRRGGETKNSHLPTYIPSGNFALALMDVLVRGDAAPPPAATAGTAARPPPGVRITVQNLREAAEAHAASGVGRAILAAIDTAEDDLARVQQHLEAWFDSGMDSVSGWYKRRAQLILFGIGLGVSVGLNANTLIIADALYQDGALRQVVVAQAEATVQDAPLDEATLRETYGTLDALALPIGWSSGALGPRLSQVRERAEGFSRSVWYPFLIPLFGWLLTAFAVTLGAPFWFDLLNKIMVIRSTVKPREKSRPEGFEDRQPQTLRLEVQGAAANGL